MGSGGHGVRGAWGQTEFQVNLKLGLTQADAATSCRRGIIRPFGLGPISAKNHYKIKFHDLLHPEHC